MIEIEDVKKIYRLGTVEVAALAGVSLQIARSEVVAIVGQSGSGKSTLMNIIGCLDKPTSGKYRLDGTGVETLGSDELAAVRNRKIGFVFQSFNLLSRVSARRNVELPLLYAGVGAGRRERAAAALSSVGLADRMDHRPTELSGGQQQRVALARALINAPQVLLLDEPLGALDLKLRRQMQLELKRIQTEVSTTFVHVTHDQEEAMTMADTIAVMSHGHVEQLASPIDLYERPATAFVANFLGKSNLLEGRVTGADGALLLVETHGVALRLPAANRPAAAATDLYVGVRPEKLHMASPGTQAPAGHNALQATVTDSSFMGVSTQYVVRTAWEQELTVFAQNMGIDGMRPRGTAVQLHWDPQHTFAVPRTGAPQETEEEIL